MRKILIILFLLASVCSAQPIIYQGTFETTKDGWTNQGLSGNRVGITYTITPVGSYMLDIIGDIGTINCITPLNLKAGRPYTISFKYNKVSDDDGADTFRVAKSYPNRAKLSGTTDYILASNPKGMSDANWRTITYTTTPTENGGYLLYSASSFYNEVMIDSIIVRGDTSSTVIRLTNPKSQTVNIGNRTEELLISWTKIGIDSVNVYLNDYLYTTTNKLYCIVPIDTLLMLGSDTLNIRITGISKVYTGKIPAPTVSNSPVISPMTGNGSYANPYMLYSAQQYLDLVDTLTHGYVHISLGNDWDFKNITITQQDIVNIHERGWFGFIDGRGFTIKNFNITRASTDSCYTEIGYAIFREAVSIKNLTLDSCNIILNKPIKDITAYDSTKSKSIFMDDKYNQGRQINLLVNYIYDTAFGSIIDNPAPQLNNIKIINSSIYVDYSNLGEDWGLTSVASVSSTCGKTADRSFQANHIFVKDVDLFYKGAVTKKRFILSGVLNDAGKISNSYFDGTISFDISPDTARYENLGAEINGFGQADYIENCYSMGSITYLGTSNSLIKINTFTRVMQSPNYGTTYLDNLKERVFIDYGAFLYADTTVINTGFDKSNGITLYNTPAINCYSSMNVIGTITPYSFYQVAFLQNANNSVEADTILSNYYNDEYEDNYGFHLGYSEQGIYQGLWFDGAINCYYNTSLSVTFQSNPQLINDELIFGKTESQLADAVNFKNWDFYADEGWRIEPSINNGMPYLEIDSLFTFTYQTTASDSTILILPVYGGQDGYLKILSANPEQLVFKDTNATVLFDIESSGIDSIKIYYSYADTLHWTYLGKGTLQNLFTQIIDTTQISTTFPLTREYGRLFVKVVSDIDTVKYGLTLTELGRISLVPDVRGCYYWGNYEGELGEFGWTMDITCGWVASYHQRERGVLSVNIVGDSCAVSYTKSIITSDITDDAAYTKKIQAYPNELTDNFSALSRDNYYGGDAVYVNGRGYYVKTQGNSSIIMMQDYKNELEYEVYRITAGSNSAKFTPGYMILKEIPGNGLILYNYSVKKCGWFGAISISNPLYAIFNYVNIAVPEAIVFKALPPPAGNLSDDTWEFGGANPEKGVKYISNKFRGIHPKIWKWGNPQGIKP